MVYLYATEDNLGGTNDHKINTYIKNYILTWKNYEKRDMNFQRRVQLVSQNRAPEI